MTVSELYFWAVKNDFEYLDVDEVIGLYRGEME